MNKKYLKIILIILIIIFAYLYLAHAYIYRGLGLANLKATNDRHEYICGNNEINYEKIIYTSLGDSLTSGVGVDKYEESYPYLLAKYLSNDSKTVINKNFSYPGARTEDLIKNLLEPTIAEQPDIITLLIGTNDIHGFVNTDDFTKNYDYILKELTTRTRAKIYLISIPNIGSKSLILPPLNYYFDYKILKYNNIIQTLAGNYNLKYIDLAMPTFEVSKNDGPYYSKDLFHPSAVGYESWAKIIYDNLNR